MQLQYPHHSPSVERVITLNDISFQIQRDGMYGIFFLTTLYEGSSHEGVALLLELGLLPTVMNFVKKQDIYYTKPALQVIVNIFQSDNKAAIKVSTSV